MPAELTKEAKIEAKRVIENLARKFRNAIMKEIAAENIDTYKNLFESNIRTIVATLVPRLIVDIHKGLVADNIQIEQEKLMSYIRGSSKTAEATEDDASNGDEIRPTKKPKERKPRQTAKQKAAANSVPVVPTMPVVPVPVVGVAAVAAKKPPVRPPPPSQAYPVICTMIKTGGVECDKGASKQDGKLKSGEPAKQFQDTAGKVHIVCCDCHRKYLALKVKFDLVPSRFRDTGSVETANEVRDVQDTHETTE